MLGERENPTSRRGNWIIRDYMKKETPNPGQMKKRLLLLQKLFTEKTDEEHPVSTQEILKYLEENGIPTNRKTLKHNLDLLVSSGMDIITVVSKPNKYFLGDRGFELPELKLLIDAVASSRFITEKKSKQLIKKITGMGSASQKEELTRNIFPTSRAKSTNETSFYAVDAINEAINRKRKIAFKYFDYDARKKKVYRNGGEKYILSPYALIWNEDFYYVLGYYEARGNISTFRVDRIRETEVLSERAKAKPKGFKVDEYARRTFEMYDGEEATVRLECRADLMKYVIDRFGEEVKTTRLSDERFVATVDVALSPTFYAWVFQFRGGIKIVSPKNAVGEIKEMAEEVL